MGSTQVGHFIPLSDSMLYDSTYNIANANCDGQQVSDCKRSEQGKGISIKR